MVNPEKIFVLDRSYAQAKQALNVIGDHRRRHDQRLHELRDDRRGITEKGKAAVLDNRIADADNEKGIIEQQFTPAYDAVRTIEKLTSDYRHWLNKNHVAIPSPTSEDEPVTRPRLSRDVSALNDNLHTIRQTVTKLSERRHDVVNAPPPASVLITQKTTEIDQVLDQLSDPKRNLAYTEVGLLFVAAHAEELKKSLTAHIKKSIGDAGLKADDKIARLSEIDAELHELQCQEERLCLEIEACGAHVVRRADFPPAVFFEVELSNALGNDDLAVAQA